MLGEDWGKVSQRGLGGSPHERLANPEGVKGKRGRDKKPFPFTASPHLPILPKLNA